MNPSDCWTPPRQFRIQKPQDPGNRLNTPTTRDIWSIIPGMEDGSPRSAYDLAMARLRQKDAEAGIENVPLTGAQKDAIAEVRNFYESKLAEREVLHQSAVRQATDAEALKTLEEHYQHDREHFASERDAKISRIRRGEP